MKLLDTMAHLSKSVAAVREAVRITDRNVTDETRQGVIQEAGELERTHARFSECGTPQGDYLRALLETTRIINGVKQGTMPEYALREAMSSDDFPLLFGDLMHKQMLGNYALAQPTYPAISTAFNLKDFKYLNLYTIDGGTEDLEEVGEYAPYPELTFEEGRYQLRVRKYGKRFGLSFELVINDDMGAMDTRPAMLAQGARFMEERLMTGLYVDANGPHASFFTSGNGNKLASNLPLTVPAIQTMMTLISRQRNSDDQPIVITGWTLVVAPAEEINARNILDATELRIGENNASTDQLLITRNWMSGKMKLVVNPFIPIIASSAHGDTSWFMFASVSGGGRPALAHGFLRGRNNPQMYMKSSNQVLLGGGESGIMEGDFDNDAINYKMRHFFGGARVDPKMAYASNGSGVAD